MGEQEVLVVLNRSAQSAETTLSLPERYRAADWRPLHGEAPQRDNQGNLAVRLPAWQGMVVKMLLR
jgi:hypothetical protein